MIRFFTFILAALSGSAIAQTTSKVSYQPALYWSLPY